MNSKKPRLSYLAPTSPNPSYYGYSTDNTFDTMNDDTIPSPVRSMNMHIGTYSLTPNQTSLSANQRQTSLSPKIQKPISRPSITRKRPTITRLNSIKITRKNTLPNQQNKQNKQQRKLSYNINLNECNKVSSIVNLLSVTTNNSNNLIEMPYIENEDDVSRTYYDNNYNTIQNELTISTVGDSAMSLSSKFNNSNESLNNENNNELIHGIIDEKNEEKTDCINNKYIIFNGNKNDIINEKNEIINDLKIELDKANNKINILNTKIDEYQDEIHELIDNVNLFADNEMIYKKQINKLQKQLTNLKRKQSISIKSKSKSRNDCNKQRISKSESKKKRRRSRTWISQHELNINEMDNINIKEYQFENKSKSYTNTNDSFANDWSCALSALNNDNSFKYNPFYD